MFNLGNLSELAIESKIGKVNKNSEIVYNFLSDFNNFTKLIPKDKVEDWNATSDFCSFKVEKAGRMSLKIIEREPNKLVKIANGEDSPYQFFFWVQIIEKEPNDTRIKLSIKAKLNPIVKAVAKNPLQNFVDTMIDQFSVIFG